MSLGEKYDAGHYFSMGGHKAVTFNEDNVHAQCVTCNRYKHGNLLEYQIGIEKRIGPERLLELHEKAHETRKYTPDELKYIIHTYKEKIKILQKRARHQNYENKSCVLSHNSTTNNFKTSNRIH